MSVQARLPALLGFVLLVMLFAVAAVPFPVQAAAQGASTALAPQSANYGCAYIVRYGDDLFRISLRYHTSFYQLMWANSLYNPNYLYAGMVLRMPCAAAYPSAFPYRPPVSYNGGYSNICAYHLVRRGEDLFRIALRYGMTWPTLAAVNHLFNPNLIFAGMRLAIPCSARSSSYAPQSNPYGPNPYSAAPAPNPYGAPPMNATPAPTAMPGQATNVTIQDFSFAPASVTVHVGQTVTWRNNGPSMHTVTSNTGAFDSGTLNTGGTFSHTFTSAGTFAYHCAIHPMMMGTVVVVP